MQGLSLSEEVRDAHLADQALVAGLRLGIPDAAIREAGAQEQPRRLLAARLLVARLVVALVIALSLWARDRVREGLLNLVDGLREGEPDPWRASQPPVKSA